MHYFLLTAITDLGDSAVLGALTLAAVIYLLLCRCRREALALASAFFAAAGGIGLLKLVFLNCGSTWRTMQSPSGHAALSLAVYGALALLFSRRSRDWRRFVPLVAAAALVSAIALTRIMLGFHTIPEIAAGLLTGAAALLIAHALSPRREIPPSFDGRILLGLALMAAFIFHGMRLPAEEWIRLIVSHIRSHTHLCGQET